jgi:hypothetical protein
MRRFALVACVGLAAAGCRSKPKSDGGAEGFAAAGVAGLPPEKASKVLAKVGNRTLTLGDFASALERMDSFDRLRYQSLERRKELLREMIHVELLAQEAEARGLDKDPAVAQAMRAVLRDVVLEEARKGAPPPSAFSASEVKAYYEAHRADYTEPERRRLSLIVLATASDARRAAVDGAKVNSAAEWGELVRSRSIDPQAAADVPLDLAGDVGFVGPPGDARGANPRVPEAVRAAAFRIADVGGVGPEPIEDGGKHYVVRLAGRSAPRQRTLEEAERSIRVLLATEAARQREKELAVRYREEFRVRIDEGALARAAAVLALDAASAERADAGPSH